MRCETKYHWNSQTKTSRTGVASLAAAMSPLASSSGTLRSGERLARSLSALGARAGAGAGASNPGHEAGARLGRRQQRRGHQGERLVAPLRQGGLP